MSSRFTSPFDDLLERNRRELDALYRGTERAGADRDPLPGREPRAPAAPAAGVPVEGSVRPGPAAEPSLTGGGSGEPPRSSAAPSPSPASASAPGSPASTPVKRLLDERYGDGWRFEVTSRRREGDEVIVVGALRLPGSGGVRTQFGSAPITANDENGASGSVGGVGFSFGAGSARQDSFATEEAAYARARDDALAHCAALLPSP